MRHSLTKKMNAVLVVLLAAALVPQSALATQNHVVKPADLQKAILDSSQARQDNIAVLEDFFSTDAAQRALERTGIDQGKIKQAVALLDDAELAQLATRVEKLQADFAGGEISDRTMLYVLIFVAVGSLIAFLIVMP